MPYEITARSDHNAVWAEPANVGQPQGGPWLTPDGRHIYDLIADGATGELGFEPRFKVTRGSRFGDLLWTTGYMKIASDSFASALEALPATGFSTYPIQILSSTGDPVEGYVGLAIDDDDPQKDLWQFNGAQFWSFAVADRVINHLRKSGVIDFDCSPLRP